MEDHPYDEKRLIDTIVRLETMCRENDMEVIFVRHEDEVLKKRTPGWQIYSKIGPVGDEKIFDKDCPSAFIRSGLKEYAREKGITRFIITGLQTDFCIDANVQAANEHGFEVVIPRGGHSTFDNKHLSGDESYHYYTYDIWKNRYATVMSVDDIEESI